MTEISNPNPDTSVSRRPAALLTGASRGIGRAIALQLAQSGYDLLLLARKEQADVSDSSACAEVFSVFDRHFPAPNLLVANAGISHLGLLQDMTPEDWDHMIRTDLSSCFYLSRLAIPRMLRAGSGKLIFLSSVWGSRGASCEVAYSAAKGGVNSFTRALAKELAPSNIQVNAIAPGAIDTDMNAWLDAEERRALEDEIPAGRLGTAEEVAALVCQLAAAPAYFTGNILTRSGGWAL